MLATAAAFLPWTTRLMYAQPGQPRQPPSAQREFDVVSIKPYSPKGALSEGCDSRGDPVMLTRTGCTLEQLVEQAYDLKTYQVRVKGPAWIETDRYVIQARLATPAPKPKCCGCCNPCSPRVFV